MPVSVRGSTGPGEGSVRLSPGRAAALWQDRRWQSFEAAILTAYDGRCERPAVDDTWVRVVTAAPAPTSAPLSVPPHSADFASDHAELRLSCQGRDGLVAVQVRAEFVRMMDRPLDLTVALVFKG